MSSYQSGNAPTNVQQVLSRLNLKYNSTQVQRPDQAQNSIGSFSFNNDSKMMRQTNVQPQFNKTLQREGE